MASTKKKTEQQVRLEKGARARGAALRELIANHQDEYDRLHAKFRVAEGLPPRAGGGASKEALEERVERQREKLRKWEAELKLAG